MGKARPDSGRHAYLGFLEGVEQRVALELRASPWGWLNVTLVEEILVEEILVGDMLRW